MISAIEKLQTILRKRKATASIVRSLETLQQPGRGKIEFDLDSLVEDLGDGADVFARCKHLRAGVKVSALSMTLGHPDIAQALVDHGAKFDETILAAFKYLVTPSQHDLPMLSQTQRRRLGEKTLLSAKIILDSGPAASLDHKAFLAALDELCEDKTSFKHPTRRLGDILDKRIPGFAPLWQAMSIVEALDDVPVVEKRGGRMRL